MRSFGQVRAALHRARASRHSPPAAAPRRPLGRQTIGFVMTTRGDQPTRVRALLELVRPHVDEVVLAVDEAGGDDALDMCADIADRRIRFRSPGTGSRLVGWAQHQVSCDWILRLDDDEVPSPSLLAALAELVADRRPLQYGFPRRWLHPGPDRYLASSPWDVEYQYRLVRNVPGLWQFDGRIHSMGEIDGDLRLVELPMYHADLLLNPLADRQRKAVAYELARPFHSYSGFPVNGMYLPESAGPLRHELTPAEDLAIITAVIGPGSLHHELTPAGDLASAAEIGPGRQPATPIESATASEVDAFNAIREVGPDAYRAHIALTPPTRLPAMSLVHFHARVHNDGDTHWPSGHGRSPSFHIGFRWRRDGDERVIFEGRNVLEETILSGGSSDVLVGVRTPTEPGAYVLELDVVHEFVRWFEMPARFPVQVNPRPDQEPVMTGLSTASWTDEDPTEPDQPSDTATASAG